MQSLRRPARRAAPAALAALLLAGCPGRPDEPPPAAAPAPAPDARKARLDRIDSALAAAAAYLVRSQDPDGGFRSKFYGALKKDPSITPLAASALFFLSQGGPEARAAFRRAVGFLALFAGDDGRIREPPDRPFVYPVYLSASASWTVVLEERSPRNLRAQAAWLDYLMERRLDAARGWKPGDAHFGGWGYFGGIPERPRDDAHRPASLDSNLSSTLFGLGALRFAGAKARGAVQEEILSFVARCQNFPPDGAKGDPAYDDGGFYLSPTDDFLNKAGAAGTDASGRARFRSYGSQTADGLRALLRCGLPGDHPRVLAARRWLERNFDPERNPGSFAPAREALRNATYYYYAWTVSHALANAGLVELRREGRRIPWPESLADALLARQRNDGAWANPLGDSKEDDPLVATSFAAAALAVCRRTISGEGPGMLFPGPPGPGGP